MVGVDLYRDVPVNCFSVDDWNSINVPPHEDYEELEGEEIETGAGGFAFRHQPNRFLYWRIQGTQVDLVEHSLQGDLTENALSLQFSVPLVPYVRIIEEMQPAHGPHAQVSLFLLTQNNRLYRFYFRHPSAIPRQVSDSLPLPTRHDVHTLDSRVVPSDRSSVRRRLSASTWRWWVGWPLTLPLSVLIA